jgi:hypothetical protein
VQYLVPFLEQRQYNLSTECRLNPDNDMFQEQENKKDRIRPSQWQCKYCDKTFRTEEYLDKHLDNRHRDQLVVVRFHDPCREFCECLAWGYVKEIWFSPSIRL